MVLGQNSAVRRSRYPLQALEETKTITRGEDDLIMQSIATPKNTKALTDKESFVLSAPHTSWTSFLDQKVRHTAVGQKYTRKARTISSVLPLCQGISLVLLLSLLLFEYW